MLLKERERKTTVTLPIVSKVKEVVNILRKEKNHLYLGILCKGFQKIGIEVDLDGYNISAGHRLQEEHRLALVERRRSSSKGKKMIKGQNFLFQFFFNARGPIN